MKWLAILVLMAGCADKSDGLLPPDETGLDETGAPLETALPLDTGPIVDWGLMPWVLIEGGSFTRGSPEGVGEVHEHPQATVTVPGYYLSATEVTLGEYRECMEDGVCPSIPTDRVCKVPGEDPDSVTMNCLTWAAAHAVCDWAGGRLPSESEWEFAATSRGQDRTYPWGEAAPTCALAISDQCANIDTPQDPCSRPDGNTDQGLCDMAGNAYEWVEDWFWDTYDTAPTDGSAMEVMNYEFRTMRGGALNSDEDLRTRNRTFHPPDFYYGAMGTRCARDRGPDEPR